MNRFTRLSLLALLLAPTFASRADAKGDNVLSATITDDAIVFPESFETDTRKLMEGWYMQHYTATDDRYSKLPDTEATDQEITNRLAALPNIIEMPYNQIVRSYIDRYTKAAGRQYVATILGLSLYYNPIFEQALEEKGLPLELKYLPVIESALDPNAVSKHGATGLWQFMLGAAKGLGLEVNSLVDERRDPYASSRTAAAFLKDLHEAYGDWSLAIAAYNCGPGAVNKAIRRAGGDPKEKDFWSIYYYLPQETRGYVPMFIAANYVMNYHQEHNISPVLPTKPLVTDTVGVPYRVHFDQISAVLDIPKDELRMLNPQFRADIIPGTPERPYTLILPSQQVHAYIMSEPQIRQYKQELYAQRTSATPGGEPEDGEIPGNDEGAPDSNLIAGRENVNDETSEEAARELAEASDLTGNRKSVVSAPQPDMTGPKRTVTHTVATGETLAEIASMYGVTPTDIRHTNGLRRNAVRPGQQLRIETTAVNVPGRQTQTKTADAAKKEAQAAQAQTPAKQTPAKNTKNSKKNKKNKADKPRKVTHTVSSGENLTTIARRYGVSVSDVQKANGGKDMIHPGDKITIPKAKAGSGSSKSKGKKGNGKRGKKRRR